MTIQLSDRFDLSRLFRFTLPSIVMMLVTSIYSVVDGLFVSNLVGDQALAAVNIVYPLVMIVGAFGFMLGAGGSAEVAKARGLGEDQLAKEYFTNLIITVVVGGAILAGACLLFQKPLLGVLGANEALMRDCIAYGTIMLAGAPIFLLQTSCQSFLVVAERPKMGLGLAIGAGVTNMLLDYVFIALFRWGVAGAAAATVCGYVVGGLVPLFYFLSKNKSPLRLVKAKPHLRMLGKSCTNGVSELMTNVSASLVTVLYNRQLMAAAGQQGVAAYTVMMYVNFVFVAALIGFSMGLDGSIARILRNAGLGVILVPIFAVLGTLLGGAVYAALSPMTLREGLAISAGFGWYTMAPSVIASAGHTMASAVSFLHNVLREMLGIILLPVIAGKIGYIEAITIPGTASTDVCLPIVEQVCNSETVAYSFCTGMLMCITSAALVPIIIGA